MMVVNSLVGVPPLQGMRVGSARRFSNEWLFYFTSSVKLLTMLTSLGDLTGERLLFLQMENDEN